MSPGVPSTSTEDSEPALKTGSLRARSLTEALRQALVELGASAVGVTRAGGGRPKYFTRSAPAAQFFEDICASGLETLKAQTQTKSGVFGTNRVRADSAGPVRGRLIAVSLRSAQGLPLGILVAVRLIEEAKFGAQESQKLLAMAREFETLLAAERVQPPAPSTPSRGMWPIQQPTAPAPATVAPAAPAAETAAPRAATPENSAPKSTSVAETLTPESSTLSTPIVEALAAESSASSAAPPIEAGAPKDPAASSALAATARIPKLDVAAAAAVAAESATPVAEATPPKEPARESAIVEIPKPEAAAPKDIVRDAAPQAEVHAPTPAAALAAPAEPPARDVAPPKSASPESHAPASQVTPQVGSTVTPAGPVAAAVAFAKAARKAAQESGHAVASLLAWTEFERQIRLQESDDRLPGCVLYGDMDQLHVINKLAGFAMGDRAISEVGVALQTAELPQGACACHLSGDRYTLYIPRTTLAQGRRIAEQISKSVSTLSVPVHSVPTPISISFGVALIPATDGGLGHALAAAEAACKAAKDRGRGRVEVYQDADQSIVRRNDDVLVADRLRQALEAGRVEVFAQPIVRLNGTPSTAHYELLVRLIGDAGTHLSPTWFMSAATRYRMLVELDRAVVGHVLAKLEAQRALLARKQLRFSVNLSGPSIGDPEFLEWIVSRIGGVGVPGEWLQFEITETAAVANIAQTQAMIRRLQARGVQFALDDFGTGVSSFAYLKYFDVKMLKLDGSFVRDLMSNPRSESLVRGIAQLGRGMNIETVAECVETAEVRDRLTQLGIDCAQGFLFGRPKPLDGVLTTELGMPAPMPSPPMPEYVATDVLPPHDFIRLIRGGGEGSQ